MANPYSPSTLLTMALLTDQQVAINTNLTDLQAFVAHLIEQTNVTSLTPLDDLYAVRLVYICVYCIYSVYLAGHMCLIYLKHVS